MPWSVGVQAPQPVRIPFAAGFISGTGILRYLFVSGLVQVDRLPEVVPFAAWILQWSADQMYTHDEAIVRRESFLFNARQDAGITGGHNAREGALQILVQHLLFSCGGLGIKRFAEAGVRTGSGPMSMQCVAPRSADGPSFGTKPNLHLQT